jgi:hypothetical protein
LPSFCFSRRFNCLSRSDEGVLSRFI